MEMLDRSAAKYGSVRSVTDTVNIEISAASWMAMVNMTSSIV